MNYGSCWGLPFKSGIGGGESERGREVEGLRVTGIRGCRDAGIGRATGTQDGGHADKETGQES